MGRTELGWNKQASLNGRVICSRLLLLLSMCRPTGKFELFYDTYDPFQVEQNCLQTAVRLAIQVSVQVEETVYRLVILRVLL